MPITVILEMLGVPVADLDKFRAWTQAHLTATDPQQQKTAIAALDEFTRYLKMFLVHKREHPGNDLTSGMIQAQDQGNTLSENELLSTIWLLITDNLAPAPEKDRTPSQDISARILDAAGSLGLCQGNNG